jgi:autotransporter-associated beta strand protein
LLFGGATRLININDFTAGSNFRNITFNTTAGAFTLNGNAITLNGGITNNDGNNQTINLDMTFPGIQTVNAAVGNIVLGGSISGAGGGLIKAGADTLTLTGTNTYDGSTTISAGILQIGNGGTLGTLGAGEVINNAVLTINRSDDLTANNAISGTGSLTKLGAGTLTLGGANSYTGATTVSVGAMRILHSDAPGTAAGGVTVANGAALELDNNIEVGAEALSLNGTGISARGALRNISGDNSWSGAITLANATRINSDSGTLTIDVASGNAITGSADNLTVGGVGNVVINDAIVTTTGTLTKDGAGTLTLAGNNIYSGITTISAGTLQVGDGGTSGTLGSGNVVNNSSLVINRSDAITVSNTLSGTGTLTKLGAGTLTLTRSNAFSRSTTISEGALALTHERALQNSTLNYNAGGGTIVFGTNSAAFTLGGLTGDKGLSLANSDGAAIVLTVGNNNSNTTYSGVLSESGSLIKAGTGTLTLEGANTYSGSTAINGGMLRLNNANALGSGNLNLNGGLLGLGAGDFTRSLGTGVGMVQLNGNSGFAAYGADRLVNLNNDLSTITWDSTANFLTNRESLVLGAADADATVDFQNPISFNGAVRTMQVNDGTADVDARLSGVLSDGGLTKTGIGTLELTANNTYTGATMVSAGTLRMLQADALGTTGGVTVAGGAALELKNNITVGTKALSLNGTGISGGGALRNISGTNSWAGTVTLTNVAGVHRITSDADTLALSNITEAGGNNKNLTFDGAGDVIIGGNITTDVATDLQLTKDGTGTLIINGATNNYGITTISNGTLQIGDGGTTGTLGTGNVINNSALVINRSDAITAANLISGTGSLTKSGAGVTTLTGANTFSGLTTISGGTLQIGAGGTIGTLGSGNVVNNAELVFNRSNAMTVSNRISGTGSLTKSGAGVTTLTGANTYGGVTTVLQGRLIGNSDHAFGINDVIVAGGAALTLTNGVEKNYIGDQARLILATNATLYLSFKGTDMVGGLSLDSGASWLPYGSYTAAQLDTLGSGTYTGTGLLLVEGFADDPAGTPHSWLAQYGLTNFNADAVADADEDGQLTWQECIAGTNPTNPASCFRITGSSITSHEAVIRWSSVSNRLYDISRSTNLMEAFTVVAGASNLPATPPENVITNLQNDGDMAFYKINVHE